MVGIREVARKAGVSPATVSRVLNNDPTLSATAETRARIHEAVKKLNYKKPERGTAKKMNHSLGLITAASERGEIEDPYFRAIRLGIEAEAKKCHIAANRIYRVSENHSLKGIEALGAVIILGNLEESFIQEIYEKNPRIVLVDDTTANESFDAVYTDFEMITKKHLERLWQLGHRNIAFIGGVRTVKTSSGKDVLLSEDVRYQTYKKWLTIKGAYKEENVFLGGWGSQDGLEMTEEMLTKFTDNKVPTAIVVASDPLAIGVYRAIQKAGKKIPEDFSIASFDNIEVTEFLTPPLTTADIETEQLGKMAVRLAKERIRDERDVPIHVVVPSRIILRESEKALDK
ncbi:AraC family transcriptional regulator [Enterococcus sp. JM4C]|uniref:LacI family DNA-binding transcriptional regulator n=1 Tax=Candidatus Enterococcus huntleyi TaxID=1857217 RepID=UPI001379BB91|nr:LacI family DNA-binding transcriptional regulator [Enterococcus sp. JM4C]KAF1298139.1 AraC family transcriptional regulator [Enterococcus sp. JM4C]